MKEMSAIDRLTKLKTLHGRLELELQSLTRRGHMTPSEQLRAQVIKKEKLKAKDEMRSLTMAVAAE